MSQNVYLCIEMSGKGSISRMSDECLMKQEFGFPFYIVYQAVMRKFTLARKYFIVQMNGYMKSLQNIFHNKNF